MDRGDGLLVAWLTLSYTLIYQGEALSALVYTVSIEDDVRLAVLEFPQARLFAVVVQQFRCRLHALLRCF